MFRGFYFTSAIQEGASVHRASERISRQFDLAPAPATATPPPEPVSQNGYFLQGLFRKVIFADRQLVKQHSTPRRTRLRYASFFGAAVVLAVVLAGWAWSYTANRQLATNVAADLEQAVEVQSGRVDLKSRIEALLILQQRLEQLDHYRKEKPLSLGLGLYQATAWRKAAPRVFQRHAPDHAAAVRSGSRPSSAKWSPPVAATPARKRRQRAPA